jgi:hypothetical protein
VSRYSLPFPQCLSKYNFSALTAIWIFGIFALAELHWTRFWDILSRQFQQRGPDYVERCIIQTELQLGADDDSIPPALFPPPPELDPDTEGTLSLANEEELNEVSDPRASFEQNDSGPAQ